MRATELRASRNNTTARLLRFAAGLLLVVPWATLSSASAQEPAAATASTPEHAEEVEAEEIDAEKAKRDLAFTRAIESLAGSTDFSKFIAVEKQLGDGFPDSREALTKACAHRNEAIRAFAIKLLGEQGSAAKDLGVVSIALADRSDSVRLTAILAVRSLGTDGFPALSAHLLAETVPNNRKMAIKTFQMWKHDDAIPVLVERLREEKDDGVRSFLVEALRALSGYSEIGDSISAWESVAERRLSAQERVQLEAQYRRETSKP